MRILVTGASGLVGSALVPVLEARGHRMIKLMRASGPGASGCPTWNPETGEIDLGSSEPFDAVIHLAGENIARRWTPEVKRRIRDSRTRGTRLLANALINLPVRPKVLVCASATGLYGSRGEEWLDETSPAGVGFLAETCQEWEAAASPARERGIRVVHLRFGLVLSPSGGVLGRMLSVFRLGLGGPLGNGRAWWSWICLDDALRVIELALADDSLHGPVNTVSPHPATSAEFARTLGRVLGRPAVLPVPGFALELVFGEMAREAMLASTRVRPTKLEEAGFDFRFPGLEAALRHLLGRSG